MAWKVELTRSAERVLREAAGEGKGWVDDRNQDLEVAELERAQMVYDGAVTGAGYLHLQQR